MTDQPVPAERTAQGMAIACPPGWHDKSMLIVNADTPGPSGVSATVVVTRETDIADLPAERAARLEAFVERQLDQMAGALAGLAVIERIHATDEQWTAELRIAWQADGVPLMQWITYADTADAVLMATATAGHADFAAAEPLFRSILRTVRLT